MHPSSGFEKYINRDDLRNTTKYVVKSGDSLYTISQKYNTTVHQIMALNNLNSTMIYPNQVLFIPNTHSDSMITLKEFLLSKQVSIDGLSADTLNMMIQKPALARDSSYEIKNGDTIDRILEQNRLSPYQILELNKDKWFRNGEKIIIK